MTTPQGIAFALPGLHARSSRARRTSDYLTSGSPLLRFLPIGLRNHLFAMLCEFFGTFFFLFFAYSGTQVAKTPSQNAGLERSVQGLDPSQLLYISLCFGFSLAVNAWGFFWVSGGLFNPAVSALESLRSGCVSIIIGIFWHVSARRSSLEQEPSTHHCTTYRQHCGRSDSLDFVSWATQCRNNARTRHDDHSRLIHRDAPDRPTGVYNLYAGCAGT